MEEGRSVPSLGLGIDGPGRGGSVVNTCCSSREAGLFAATADEFEGGLPEAGCSGVVAFYGCVWDVESAFSSSCSLSPPLL